MSFGPTSVVTIDTVDMSAPGAPLLDAEQLNNSLGRFRLTPPLLDSDGSALTGLTFAEAVVIQADGQTAELYRNDFDGAKSLPGAQPFIFLSPTSGVPIEQTFAIFQPGMPYSVLARCADHPAPDNQ